MSQKSVYESIRALLEEAMTMEHAACEGYALLADAPENDAEIREMYRKFSEMEALHFQQLRKKYMLYGGASDWAPTSTGREFLNNMGLEGKTPQAVMTLCQDMEQRHADFYVRRKSAVNDPVLKAFFQHLAEQEQQHVLDLQKLLA